MDRELSERNTVTEMTLEVSPASDILTLFGPRDQHLRALRVYYDVAITQRDGRVRISGEHNNVRLATRAMKALRGIVQREGILTADDVERVLAEQRMAGEADGLMGSKGATHVEPAALPPIDLHQAGRRVKPRTAGQAAYVEAIRKQDLTFCAGPAGSGKTYLAVACAVEAFKEQRVRKIVLVRPAVEAGENLGFLPGDLRAKLNPYLRPLLDAINEMVDYDQARELMEREIVEVVPLAYMRGRTLNDAFIILDEAQNTTVPQMKMFLTRMGERSRMVVSGDTSQVDLPRGVQSGLRDAMLRLGNIAEIGMIRLQKTDIVRHALVQQIVRAYEEQDS